MNRLRLMLVLLVGLAASACDGPTAGEISIHLVTPNTGDGAILFKIEAPSSKYLDDITAACSGCRAFTYRTDDSELFCVVTGSLTSGPLARIAVSDVGVGSVYAITIMEIAGVDYRLRSTVGYELRVSR